MVGEARNYLEKRAIFNRAKEASMRLGLPLMNVGCKYTEPFISLSDVNVDVVPRNVQRFVQADIQELSQFFEPKSHVIYASHILEHVDDPQKALEEILKVGREVYVITPNPLFLQSWLWPDHKTLWLGNYEVKAPQTLMGPLVTGLTLLLASF